MQTSTPKALRAALAAHPDASASTFLRDDSFAAYLYDHMNISQLRSAFQRDADPRECEKWRLTPREWRQQVEMAFVARAAAHEGQGY